MIAPQTFVLVHGAWHGSWCWRRVAEALRAGGHLVNKTYIACTHPGYEPLLPTHEWVRRQKGWRYLEFASGHDAMVLQPDALTEVLIGCA